MTTQIIWLTYVSILLCFGYKHGVLSRSLGHPRSPPCFFGVDTCSTNTNVMLSNDKLFNYLESIEGKVDGAHSKAITTKDNIEKSWKIIRIITNDIPTPENISSELFSSSVNIPTKIAIVYDQMNELANYIDHILNDEGGLLNTDHEVDMKSTFTSWQDEIYRCMCELKFLLGAFNSDSCIEVPSGPLASYFETRTQYTVTQQKAIYWVALKGINDLNFIKQSIYEIRSTLNNSN